jgi:hypothetical protein
LSASGVGDTADVGENAEVTSPEVATNWLMANGWASHGEIAATSADDWRRRGRVGQADRGLTASLDNPRE